VFIVFDDHRPSDSPFVERVWRCHSERAGMFLSIGASQWEMVVTRQAGRAFMTIRGPETRASRVYCPADGEWVAIRFKLGTFMPQHPVASLLDRNDTNLPAASDEAFWMNGARWEFPGFDNADTFVARLAGAGLIQRDAAVEAALHGDERALSRRSVQRHFRRATGMTQGTFRQIERARHATTLLRDGLSILDTVGAAGYFDQAHLTRSLKRFVGQTPGDIVRATEQLSFLYKTTASG
jgi:AraC-like DNA-binding protein